MLQNVNDEAQFYVMKDRDEEGEERKGEPQIPDLKCGSCDNWINPKDLDQVAYNNDDRLFQQLALYQPTIKRVIE